MVIPFDCFLAVWLGVLTLYLFFRVRHTDKRLCKHRSALGQHERENERDIGYARRDIDRLYERTHNIQEQLEKLQKKA